MGKNFNENLELSALACLFKDGSLFPIVEDVLEKKSFGWNSYGIIFQSIKDVVYSDLYPDIVTVYTDLDKKGLSDSISILSNGLKGKEALDFIASLQVNSENLESYAFQISELYANRQLKELIGKVDKWVDAGKRPIEILSQIDLETGKISAFIGVQSKNTISSKDAVQKSVEQFQEAASGNSRYISTGLAAWDDFTGGLFPQRLYVVSARSNEGKSALVLNIIKNLSIERNIQTKFFSLEMSSEEQTNRLIQMLTGISAIELGKGKLLEKEIDSFKEAIRKIKDAPIFYDDSPELNLALLRTKIRKSVADGAKVIIIDQLENLMIGGSGDLQPEYIRLNYIGYRIKAFSREMDVPIILVHQLNRASDSGQNRGKNTDLQLSDLSQAGEKPSDAVLMIKNKDKAYFYWPKNRQGKRGKREVNWDGSHLLFSDIPGMSEYPDFMEEEKED